MCKTIIIELSLYKTIGTYYTYNDGTTKASMYCT